MIGGFGTYVHAHGEPTYTAEKGRGFAKYEPEIIQPCQHQQSQKTLLPASVLRALQASLPRDWSQSRVIRSPN